MKKDLLKQLSALNKKQGTLKQLQKEEGLILDKITERVDFIWRKIAELEGCKIEWWSFSNDDAAYNNDGDGSDGGYFDPVEYKDDISIIGERVPNKYNSPYYGGFPTRFIEMNDSEWQLEVKNNIQELNKPKVKIKLNSKTHKDLCKDIGDRLKDFTIDQLKKIQKELNNL